MSNSRNTVFVLILIGVVSAFAGLLGNVAAGALPADWQPYLWLAWPLFLLFTAAGIGLAIWQARRNAPQSQPPPPAQSPTPPVTQSPTPPITQPTNLPISQSTNLPISQSTNLPISQSTPSFPYDVFISHDDADAEWVEQTLLPELERAGVRVCVAFRDFVAGKPRLVNVQDAIAHSRFTVLVVTKHWAASQWSLYDAILARTQDPAGLLRSTIPVLLEACELPEAIAMLTGVDFTRPARRELAWRQLLTAVGRPPAQEAEQPATPKGWFLAHPYAMSSNFTGRRDERALLSDWLDNDGQHPLLVLRALGGFGKSALTWHWLLHDVDASRWPRVVWWSFYEPQATFERFLAETLTTLGVDGRRFPGPRQQADALLALLRQPGVLLILDGFERALRAYSSLMAAYQGDEATAGALQVAGGQMAGGTLQVASGQAGGASAPSGINHSPFPNSPINHSPFPNSPINHSHLDCVSPIAEHFLRSLATLPGLRGKALMTTRLTPRVLHGHDGEPLLGCREVALTQMQPADAVAFFHSQGIRGGRAEIEAACSPYGYHPLSLRLLAGLVKTDVRQPGDIAAAKRLDVSGDLVQRQHHVLATAYDSLPAAQQQLLSRIACFRGPVAYDALAALLPSPSGRGAGGEGDAALRDLLDRGLLHRDIKTNRFDLHPIVRRYAYDRLGGDARSATHAALRDYFAAVPPTEKPQTLDDLAPVIELYHHTLAAGQYDAACDLFYDRINQATYYQFGAYQLRIELLLGLFPDGEQNPPRLKQESAQAWTLNALANSYSLSGQPRRAAPLFERVNDIYENVMGNKQYLAIGLGNLASMAQIHIGALRAAEANLRRRIELCLEIGDAENEGTGIYELGRVLTYCGRWDEAAEQFDAAEVIKKRTRHVQAQGIIWAYRALRALLLVRATPLTPNPSPLRGEGDRSPTTALHAARRSLELAEGGDPNIGGAIVSRDMVRAHWLLGAACRADGDPDAADRHLTEALTRCRGINLVEFEADILLDLARLRRDQSQISEVSETSEILRDEALRLAQEALAITERSGYVLQGADVHLFLAQLSLDAGDRTAALAHARLARQLAACDGPPDTTYKAAYEEAGAMVGSLEHEGAK